MSVPLPSDMSFAALTALVSFCLSAQAGWEDFGDPFKPGKAAVHWQVTHKQLPAELIRYRVSMAPFSDAVVSNVVALAGFADESAARVALRPALRGDMARYEESATGKFVAFSPSRGRIYFSNRRANPGVKDAIVGVPTPEQALSRLLAMLPVFGLSETNFAAGIGTNRFRTSSLHNLLTRRNPQTKEREKVISRQGVYLHRPVDGIHISGGGVCGGARAEFAQRGELAELEIVWRNLVRPERLRVPAPDEIIRSIQRGDALTQTTLPSGELTSVTITDWTLYYWGEDGLTEQEVVEPFFTFRVDALVAGKSVEMFLHRLVWPK